MRWNWQKGWKQWEWEWSRKHFQRFCLLKYKILEEQCEWKEVEKPANHAKGHLSNLKESIVIDLVEGKKELKGKLTGEWTAVRKTETWSPLQDCLMSTWILWAGFWLYRDRNDIDSSWVFWCVLFKEEGKTILYPSLLVVRWHSLRNITHGGHWGTWAI